MTGAPGPKGDVGELRIVQIKGSSGTKCLKNMVYFKIDNVLLLGAPGVVGPPGLPGIPGESGR